MYLEPGAGTVLGGATVTKVEERPEGRYRVRVEPRNSAVPEWTYTLSKAGASDVLTPGPVGQGTWS